MTSRENILPNLHFYDHHPVSADIAADVIAGLKQPQPRLHPKYLYNERGSELFEAITRQPEYYPTRTESSLLKQHAGELRERFGERLSLTEPGAGNCEKARYLLDDWRPSGYTAVEISREQLLDATRRLALEYPELPVTAVCADYTSPLELPDTGQGRLMFFPGSTIGNFEPDERELFLKQLRRLAGGQGALLIGADLHKDTDVLDAAYNDAAGITAAFNLNMLDHLNRILDAGFEVDAFSHRAFYDPVKQRIEMHLDCHREQVLNIAGESVLLSAGSSIHTENSYKFRAGEFSGLLTRCGFRPVTCWQDDDALFSLHLAVAA
jgi:L-histidine N-alpha-methyltransferase